MKRSARKQFAALICIFSILLAACPASASSYPVVNYGGSVWDYAMISGTATLNLRDGPGTEYNWLASAAEGTWVGLIGEYGNWYQVFLPERQLYGYMSKNFLKRSDGSGGSGSETTGVVNNPVATQFLNLRQYPSYSAPVLGIYYNGATFRLLSSSDGWYQVEIGGLIGYFRHEFVRLNGGGSGQIAYVKTPNGGKVNLRNAPTYTGSAVIAQFANGSQVQVLLGSSKSTFWKVSIQGITGYMDSSFLTTSGSYPPIPPAPGPAPQTNGYAIVNNPKATQFLNLRTQPSTSAKVIAQYKNGIRFEVIEPGETWCKVYGSSSGNIGYLMTKYLKLYNVSASPIKTVRNGNSYVNLRSAPSKQSGTVYQRVPSGATVTVLIPGDEWTQVRYGNTVGYMMTYFLK